MVVDSETLLFPSGTYLADLWGMKEELVAFIKIALSGRTPKIDDHGLKASPLCLYGGQMVRRNKCACRQPIATRLHIELDVGVFIGYRYAGVSMKFGGFPGLRLTGLF